MFKYILLITLSISGPMLYAAKDSDSSPSRKRDISEMELLDLHRAPKKGCWSCCFRCFYCKKCSCCCSLSQNQEAMSKELLALKVDIKEMNEQLDTLKSWKKNADETLNDIDKRSSNNENVLGSLTKSFNAFLFSSKSEKDKRPVLFERSSRKPEQDGNNNLLLDKSLTNENKEELLIVPSSKKAQNEIQFSISIDIGDPTPAASSSSDNGKIGKN